MNGAPESQTAASASPLVGPYPIDEDALRRLKRSHDGGVIDAREFKRRKAEALGLREGTLAWASHAVSLAAPTPRQTFPVRPELFKFTDPRSVCQLNGTSKTLQIDLQGTKAWARLAEAQLPPPRPRDDDEALARVRPHWRRRLLAEALPPTRRVLEGVTLLEALSRPAPAPVAYTPNELSDFTFFLRLTDGAGELIWEGDLRDLRRQPDGEGIDWQLSLRHANFKWTQADDDDREDLKIALVAIRDEDQAMVSLGHFDNWGGPGTFEGELWYNFYPSSSPSRPLFSSGRSQLVFFAALYFTQEADVFRPERLELTLHHVVHPPCLDPHRRYLCTDTSEYSYDLGEPQLRHVLSYVARINPLARASALATIESWFVDAEQEAGWDNPRAALAARLAELEERIGRALEVESDPDYRTTIQRESDYLRPMADALRAELDA